MTQTAGGSNTPMPVAFIGHGTPMNALDRNRFTDAWRAFGASVPRPRAILVISAHWYIHASAVTAMPQPKTIHDFYGFPAELFATQYRAPGDPQLADEVAEIVKPTWIGLDGDSWGSLESRGDFPLAAPTPDHFIPLIYLAGLAAAGNRPADVLVDGYAMGSLSMTSYTLGCHAPQSGELGGSPALPPIPADETNM